MNALESLLNEIVQDITEYIIPLEERIAELRYQVEKLSINKSLEESDKNSGRI